MEFEKNLKKKYKLFVDIDKNKYKIESFENLIIKNKNQLFHSNPQYSFIKKILKILMNNELFEPIYFEFSKKYLINKNIKQKFDELLPELKKIYLNCKHEKYLENLNEKKIITIIRQLIRPYNYCIKTKEKYENGKKYLLYILNKNNFSSNSEKDYVINFD